MMVAGGIEGLVGRMQWEKAQREKRAGRPVPVTNHPMSVSTDLPTVPVTKRARKGTGGRKPEDVQAIMVRPGDLMVRQINKRPQNVEVISVERGASKMIIETNVRTFRLSPMTVVTVFR